MSNDLYQRQLEKAQKRLEHSSNCLAGLTKDRNAAVLSKKARKKLRKENSYERLWLLQNFHCKAEH